MATVVVSSCIVVLVAVAGFMMWQNQRHKANIDATMTDLVEQINKATRYTYTFDKNQETNVKNLDTNIKIVHEKVQRITPDDFSLCIANTCVTENDLIKLKGLPIM